MEGLGDVWAMYGRCIHHPKKRPLENVERVFRGVGDVGGQNHKKLSGNKSKNEKMRGGRPWDSHSRNY